MSLPVGFSAADILHRHFHRVTMIYCLNLNLIRTVTKVICEFNTDAFNGEVLSTYNKITFQVF